VDDKKPERHEHGHPECRADSYAGDEPSEGRPNEAATTVSPSESWDLAPTMTAQMPQRLNQPSPRSIRVG